MKEILRNSKRLRGIHSFLTGDREALSSQGTVRHKIENVDQLPDWWKLIDSDRSFWEDHQKRCLGAPKILLPTTVGGLGALSSMESLLAVALTLRGFDVHVLLCDEALPACLRVEYTTIKNPEDIVTSEFHSIICKTCQRTGDYLFTPLGIKVHRLSELIKDQQREEAKERSLSVPLAEIPSLQISGISVGEHAHAGTLRYFASGNLDDQEFGEAVLRRYLEASILTMDAVNELTQRHRYQSSCFNHGIYCPHGVIGEVLRSINVHVTTWNIAYRKKCFIFSHDDTYHHTLLNEPNSNWEEVDFSNRAKQQIVSYLKSRLSGSRDWIWFHEKPQENFTEINKTLGLDLSKPIIGMLTNVMWDAQLHYQANAFPNMLSWVIETITYFSKRTDLQLVIRIHPAEIRGTLPSRQPLLAEISKRWPVMPENIKVVGPESQISTYAVMDRCDSVIIFGTKTGVELTSMGIPVIVAGEAWIRNKKVTFDASSLEEYLRLLDTLPLGHRLDAETRMRALKYAFHFFYRRMIPLHCMGETGAWPPYKPAIHSLKELLPGVDKGLDIICDGITQGTAFIYPAENFVHRRQRLLARWRQEPSLDSRLPQRSSESTWGWLQHQEIRKLVLLGEKSPERTEDLFRKLGSPDNLHIHTLGPSIDGTKSLDPENGATLLAVDGEDEREVMENYLSSGAVDFVMIRCLLSTRSGQNDTFDALHQTLSKNGYRFAGFLDQTVCPQSGQPLSFESIYRRD